MSRLTQNDTNLGMYGVQSWSAGPLYPAVIRCDEAYARADMTLPFVLVPLDSRLRHRSWTVILGGEEITGYASRDDAEQAAAGMVAELRDRTKRAEVAARMARSDAEGAALTNRSDAEIVADMPMLAKQFERQREQVLRIAEEVES